MEPTVLIVLVLTAFICTIASTLSPPRVALWVAVLLICVIELLRALPLGRGGV